MKAIHWIVAVLTAVSLSGCFTANPPLITDVNAVAPYAKISFATTKKPDEWKTLVRDGKAYVGQTDKGDAFYLRLMPAGDDGFYLAQASQQINGQIFSMYAAIKLSADKKTVTAYRAISDVDKDAGPGLVPCTQEKTTLICIHDVDAYMALARTAEKAGHKDMAYNVKLEE